VNLLLLLLPEAVAGQVERSLEQLWQPGEQHQTLPEQKARQKVLRKKSFLSAKLSVGEIKEHLPRSPEAVLPLGDEAGGSWKWPRSLATLWGSGSDAPPEPFPANPAMPLCKLGPCPALLVPPPPCFEVPSRLCFAALGSGLAACQCCGVGL